MARKKQETLVLFPDVYLSTEKLTDAQFGALMRAAFSYRFGGAPYEGDDIMVDLMFGVLKTQLDRYRQVCESNTENINARYATQQEEDVLRNSTESYEMLRNPTHNHTHTRNHTHTHNHSHNHNLTHNPGEYADRIPDNQYPGISDISEYCEATGLTNVDPCEFWCYYAGRGWEDDKGNHIMDWRALLHTWNQNSC